MTDSMQQKNERNAGRFVKGGVGNPKGRAPGSKNRMTQVLDELGLTREEAIAALYLMFSRRRDPDAALATAPARCVCKERPATECDEQGELKRSLGNSAEHALRNMLSAALASGKPE